MYSYDVERDSRYFIAKSVYSTQLFQKNELSNIDCTLCLSDESSLPLCAHILIINLL